MSDKRVHVVERAAYERERRHVSLCGAPLKEGVGRTLHASVATCAKCKAIASRAVTDVDR